MSLVESISKKRQKQIDDFLSSPIIDGDIVVVVGKSNYKVIRVDGDSMTVNDLERGYKEEEAVPISSVTRRSFRHIGADPFDPDRNKARIIQFSLDSIIHTLDLLGERKDGDRYSIEGTPVMSCNWDPYVYDKDGNKQRYQRPFVWKTSQKQALISSIYNGVDCGKVLVRERDYGDLMDMHAKGERELAFHDIIDGKQRMNAVREFILGEFKDAYGNKYADLSSNAQSNFLSHQLFSYCSLPYSTSDAEVLRQFLKLNFSGIPQSKTHMKYVDSLYRNAQ